MALGILYIHSVKRIVTETCHNGDIAWTYLHLYHENDAGEETCFTVAAFHKEDIPNIPIKSEEPYVSAPGPTAEGDDCPF